MLIRHFLGPKEEVKKKLSIIKGILERFMLFLGLLNNYPQIIIAFAALKLGTRIIDDKVDLITNDYFLVGNFVSILLAFIYTIAYNKQALI